MDRLDFTISGEPLGPCRRFWNVANWNKPFRLLDVARMERLARYAPFVDALNCVYILGGRQRDRNTWYKGLASDGAIDADFTGLIEQIQACLDQAYTPLLVLDNTPYPMSDPPTEHVYGNTAPPADERIWRDYVAAAVAALVDAFGAETVAGWSFRVGTEPDFYPGHWSGTKQQWFDHYDYTVDAVVSVLPEVRIGPGNILNPVEGEYGVIVEDQWGLDIIDHCAAGRNACTGEVGTRMDWFSCSWYGRIGVPLAMFDKAVGMIRERLGRYERFAETPVSIGEFAVLHDETGTRLYSGDTTEWSASFYAGIADRVYRHGVEKVYEWHHATDGVLHPKGQVIAMLERMAGGERLAVSPAGGAESDSGMIAVRRPDALYLLLYHHATGRERGADQTFTIALDDVGGIDGAAVEAWTVDADHGCWARAFAADCEAAGVPPREGAGRFEGGIEFAYGRRGFPVWRANRRRYEAMAHPEPGAAAVDLDEGAAKLTVPMPGHTVRLLRLPRS